VRLLESFWLYGENGTKYKANIYQEMVENATLQGRSSIPGMKIAELENGDKLNQVGDRFRIVATGELLSREAPTKP